MNLSLVVIVALVATLAFAEPTRLHTPAKKLASSVCSATEALCDAPESCGGFPGCGCQCAACPTCLQAQNPPFDKACAVNVVLVLDESASIAAFAARDQVVSGARSFFQVLSKVNDIDGTANLAVIEFSDFAQIILDGQPRMHRLTAERVKALNGYLDNPLFSKTSPFSYDPQYGCTNWQDVMRLVFTTSWCAETRDQAACEPAKPDIVVWFTDGEPTVHDGVCNRNCNAGRRRISSPGAIGPGNGGDLGGACYYADLIKQQGTKIFLVGVGSVASFIPNVQLVTGPVAWDTSNPDSFRTADYVVNLDYAQLATFFFNIAKGLCRCLQNQEPCVDFPNQAVVVPCVNQTVFDARMRVRTTARSVNYPANSLTYGFIYYRFASGDKSVYAVDVQGPSASFATAGDVIRTDLFEPCQVLRKITCSSGCFSVTDKSFIPRFFLAAGDAPSTPLSGFTSSCGTPYIKGDASTPESIQYVWVARSRKVCAARAVDGTLYEFFEDTAGTTPGVNLREPLAIGSSDPTQPFDFARFANCPAKSACNAAVEVVYIVDGRFTLNDYALVKNYIRDLIGSYDDANNNVRIGIVLANSVIPADGKLMSDLAGLSRLFDEAPQQAAPIDFYTRATFAIDLFWPQSFVPGRDAPRYLLTVVGGPDAHGPWSSEELAIFNKLKEVAHVESWAVGVAQGSIEIATLQNLADTLDDSPSVAYTHFEVLGTADLLVSNKGDQSTRMCPTSDLCGDDCLGLCVCGQCLCANCVGPSLVDKCFTTCCDQKTKLCSFARKEEQIAPFGCIPAGDTNPCIKYTCEASTGVCGVDETCKRGCGCAASSIAKCQFHDLDTKSCGSPCNPKPRQCNCNDLCGSQCSNNFCSGSVTCNDGNPCTSDACQARVVDNVVSTVCVTRDISQQVCPSQSPCTLAVCDGNYTANNNRTLCSYSRIPGLFDVCGVCLGDGRTCIVTSAPNQTNSSAGNGVGPIVGGVIGGIAAAAAAGLLAAWARQSQSAAPEAANTLENAALQSNPTYATPGLAGDMPTI